MPGLSDQHGSEGVDRIMERPRVLVVDDCIDIAFFCAKMLQSAGFEVATAHDGCNALRIAFEFQPSVTLLDIGLPDIDGFEVARRLRADAKFKSMTLIAFTAYSSEEARSQAKALGFDYYLVKPVPFAELLSVLEDGTLGRTDRARASPTHRLA